MPPKNPDEMYPEEGPPPRRSMTYVTIHPTEHVRVSLKMLTVGIMRRLTSERHFDADVDEDETRQEVNVAQAHHLFVLAAAPVRPVVLCG